MRTVNNLVNTTTFKAPHSIPQQAQQTNAISKESAVIINRLFVELKAIFPAWKYTFPDEKTISAAKKTWAKGFIENGITSLDRVQLGLRRARASGNQYFPSVGVFIAWCHPSINGYGLPDERTAYLECCGKSHDLHQDWSHPGVYLAGKQTGFYLLKSRTENETYPLFKKNYQQICERVLAGEQLDLHLPKALPKPIPKTPTAPADALNHISKLKAALK